VTGLLFGELHEQFEEIYDEMLAEDYDATAEQVRALGERPYAGLGTLSEKSVLRDATLPENYDATDMLRELYEDNERIIRIIQETERIAEEAGAEGVLDFVNGRHATHNMIRYKLGSYLGGPTNPAGE
jgi:DNA-binding ferritin-like protein